MNEHIEALREKANKLPLLPGVYCMRSSAGEIIYVGKAKNLKNRVTTYFRGEHEPKTAAMVDKVVDFDVIVAASEFEALVLENSLIKRHQPHYNILLRDDKSYPFIRLDLNSEYPRFSIVNRTASDGAKYFGPFGGRSQTREILDTISKALGLPTCGRRFPRDIGRERPCLNYHMGTCAGYCRREASQEEYRRAIGQAVMILEGKTAELTAELEEKMAQAAEELRFEQAAAYRDRLRAVEGLRNRQRVIATVYADTDVVGFYRGAKSCFAVVHYTGGDLTGKDYELIDEPLETDAEALSAFIRQYYTQRGAWPKQILLPLEPEDMAPLEQLLSEAAGRRVRLETPQRGERVRLTEQAAINAREEAIRATTAAQRRNKTLEWLQRLLDLPELPQRIEAYDISNTGNFGIVGAMVVFVGGKPLKRDYRRFRIKAEAEGEAVHQDDYGAMRQVLTRRFRRYLEGDAGFAALPDLLLIDGGAVHAATAASALEELGLSLPVYGMVKDDRHRTRALMTPEGEERGLTGSPAVFALVGDIQEEVHRYAIEYHRSLRRESLTSRLDAIPGVGAKRRDQLLQHFKTVKAVSQASEAELAAVVPSNVARAVYRHFHPEDGEKETK